MKYYTITQFSKEAQTTPRTIRFYIKNGLLKSEFNKNDNITVISEEEFMTMQMITLLKSAQFTLNEIKEILKHNTFKEQLRLQKNILLKQITESEAMLEMIDELENNGDMPFDYLKIYQHHLKRHHYHQQFLANQDLDCRIQFHERYNHQTPEWFEWLYLEYQINPNDKILDIGCGQGTIWQKNLTSLPKDIQITLVDASKGMIDYCQQHLSIPQIEEIKMADVHHLPYPDQSFDVIIANHLFMYFDDLDNVLKEVKRVLKPNGRLYASTISQQHNLEFERLLKSFDQRANMGQNKLTDQFSLENGEKKLSPYFKNIKCSRRIIPYLVDDTELLCQYIYSTKWIGNVQEVLEHRYNEFYRFVAKEMAKTGSITTTNYSGQFIAIAKD